MSDASMPAIEAAKAKGLVVLRPKRNELFVDIDDDRILEVFETHVRIVKTAIQCTWKVSPSPSGRPGRWHATVKLARPVKDAFERIMLQALLGSDLLHEVLSWQAAMIGNDRPTCFFEKPGVEAKP